jgi:4-amino-4-deoxy-L-arabinose transferase-like glycosyltransferase
MVHPGYRKRVIALLFGLLIVRLWFAQTFELSGQEAYIWLQGHGTNLSTGYWERGPLLPWLVRIGTIFFGDTELGVRWIAAWIACGTGFVLFYLARHWFTPRAAFWTVVVFVVAPIFAWKLCFMTEATASIGLMALAMLAFVRALEEDHFWWWLLGGAACGLALLISVANVWWLVGLLLYLGLDPERRARLREPLLWVTLIVAVLFLAPMAWWWNGTQVADIRHQHLISSFPFSHPFSLNRGFHFIGLEIFYLGPFFFVLMVFLLTRLGRRLWDDERYAFLVCLAGPGLLWQNLAAFFQEGKFELVPALTLPLVLLIGCYGARIARVDRISRRLLAGVFVLTALQTIAGLNPFYLFAKSDGQGYQLRRTQSGESVTGFDDSKRQISWRNLSDVIEEMQRDQGATLVIADAPPIAAALSFYLPHHEFVYAMRRPDLITQFDFWPQYDESASPNDSALYVTRTNAPPPDEIYRNFTTVTLLDDPPLAEFDRSWNVWSCKNFRGGSGSSPIDETSPMPESDALPKK